METIFIIAVILFAIYWQFYFLKDSIKMINQLKNIFSEKQSYHSKDTIIYLLTNLAIQAMKRFCIRKLFIPTQVIAMTLTGQTEERKIK